MDDNINCPICGQQLEIIWENNGFDGFDGPRKDECYYYCGKCGEEIIPEDNQYDE